MSSEKAGESVKPSSHKSPLLTNQEFLEGLANFYELTREKGSVWVTLKRGNSIVSNNIYVK